MLDLLLKPVSLQSMRMTIDNEVRGVQAQFIQNILIPLDGRCCDAGLSGNALFFLHLQV
jgi:hypothetical protein